MLLSTHPGYCRNRGHRDALQSWRDRDEDTVKAPAEGAGPVLAAARREAGKGRAIPPAGQPRPQPGRMGGKRSAGLAQRTASAPRSLSDTPAKEQGWPGVHNPATQPKKGVRQRPVPHRWQR